jgi:SAM-dependent methyltransferase
MPRSAIVHPTDTRPGRLLRYGVDAPYVPLILGVLGVIGVVVGVLVSSLGWMLVVGAIFLVQTIILHTGDMTDLPFPDGAFDVVVSSLAIHNLPTLPARFQAIDQAMRVLRPGGRLVVADIRTVGKYAEHLRAVGAADVRTRNLGPGFWFSGPWQATSVVTATKP